MPWTRSLPVPGAVLIAGLFLGEAAQAQQPVASSAQQMRDGLMRQTQASFCRSQGLLACLKLEKADCEKRIGPIMNRCLGPAGAAQPTQNEHFVRASLLGCVIAAFLSDNPRAKEATACIQQAGRKS